MSHAFLCSTFRPSTCWGAEGGVRRSGTACFMGYSFYAEGFLFGKIGKRCKHQQVNCESETLFFSCPKPKIRFDDPAAIKLKFCVCVRMWTIALNLLFLPCVCVCEFTVCQFQFLLFSFQPQQQQKIFPSDIFAVLLCYS